MVNEAIVKGKEEKPPETEQDPSVIPVEDQACLLEVGLKIVERLKRGRYGVVYSGHFVSGFALERLQEFHQRRSTQQHLFVRQPLTSAVQAGRKFAVKFCDIEKRKAWNVSDIEERVRKEVNFYKRVGESDMIVRVYFMMATSNSRFYLVMEQADNNLQVVITEHSKEKKILEPVFVIDLYGKLVETIRWLHAQKLTHGSIRTSNILVFYNTAHSSPSTITASGYKSSPDTGRPPRVKSKEQSGKKDKPSGGEFPFRVKLADFVKSIQLDKLQQRLSVIDDALEQDLDDLFFIHYEMFELTRINFAKYQAYKESLKMLTDFNAFHNSVETLDRVLELNRKFKAEQHK